MCLCVCLKADDDTMRLCAMTFPAVKQVSGVCVSGEVEG